MRRAAWIGPTVVLLALLAADRGASAAPEPEEQARALFAQGRAEFDAERYEAAYHAFKQAYLLVKLPAFLYNMASALERLGRPHEGAEELRAYLRARPDDPDRASHEERIRALEEAQRILDADLQRRTPPLAAAVAAPPRRPLYRRWWLWTTIGAVVVAGTAVGVGLGLGLSRRPRYPDTQPTDGHFTF